MYCLFNYFRLNKKNIEIIERFFNNYRLLQFENSSSFAFMYLFFSIKKETKTSLN